jgi:threonine/homoserine/homoserine lactone efflux protein
MIPLHNYLLYIGLYAIAVATPGPGVIAIIARALGSGFRACIPAVLGVLVGDLCVMSLSVFGLSLIAQTLGHFFLGVKIAGGLYLLYLGYKYWTSPVEQTEAIVPTSAGRGFIAYLGLTLGNPKAIVFFVALLPLAINPRTVTLTGYLQLVLATCIVIPTIELSYAAMAARLRKFVASHKARKRINKSAGAVMACAGVAVMVS